MAMIQFWTLPPDEYLTLIGRFIVNMSHVETYLKQLFWKTAGLGHELGALMTGGAPLDHISWLLKQLYDKHSDNQLVVDDIESILAEVASLKLVRDQMAHRQWHDDLRGGVILSHRALAKTAKSIQETPYTIEDLEQFCIRVHVLSGRILRHLIARPGVPMIEANWYGQYALPLAPWLDRSTPREANRGKRRDTHQKQ